MRLRHLLTIILLAFFAHSLSAQSVRLSVSPAGSVPGVGDTFYIIVDTHNVSGEPQKPASVPGAKVLFLQRRKMHTYTAIGNGVSTTRSEASYAITLRAEKAGSYTFGPITIGGVKSNSVSYKIGATSSASSQPAAAPGSNQVPTLTNTGGSDLFLRAAVSNASPYEQQGVVYTVKLYTTYSSIFDWIATTAPSFGNCTYESTNVVSRSLKQETYNGKTYYTVTIARYIIYPTQTGKALIKGNSYTGSVGQTLEYSDPYYGRMAKLVPKQVDAKPNDIELNVRPLPDIDQYDDVNGVGSFNVKAELITKNIMAHQAAVVRYTVSGTGNMSYVSLPDLAEKFPDELKFLKSEDAVNKSVGESSVSGTVTFDCTFIPQKEGDFTIPALTFNFFNPEDGKWYTRKTRSFPIKVGKGSAAHSGESSFTFIDALQNTGNLSRNHTFMISSSLFFLWYLIPVCVLLIVLLIYRKRLRLLADTTLLRQKKASRVARRRLRKAEKHLRRDEASIFYDEMLRSLWGYLSDKLDIPTSELNRGNVTEALTGAAVSEAVSQKLIHLLDDCEFAKYASQSDGNMHDTYYAACELIDSLESSIDKQQS